MLAAAHRLIAEHGLGIGHDQIAREAGVAVGTVYRRFPDKAALVAALFTDQVERVIAVAEQALASTDPWQGIVDFLHGILALQAESRGLRELSLGSPHGRELAEYSHARIAPVVAQLVSRAHAAGVLRPEVEASDLAMVPVMLAPIMQLSRDLDADLWRRTLTVVLNGMSNDEAGRRELPGSAPTDAQLTTMITGVSRVTELSGEVSPLKR